MLTDLPHKIANTKLSRTNALLPMFEAVVNSLQAIEDRGQGGREIKIHVVRGAGNMRLEGGASPGPVTGFTITDTGIGFTPENLKSFYTADSSHKAARGGKGLGRFVWLKAFKHAEIESHYRDNGAYKCRSFKFSETHPDPPTNAPKESSVTLPLTTVKLVEMKSPYAEHCQQQLETIGQRLIEHCLPYFLRDNCPKIRISDEFEKLDPNNVFEEVFKPETARRTFTCGEHQFTLTGLRLYKRHELRHRLIYAADGRAVKDESLERYIPNLQGRLSDEQGQQFVYLGFVEGDYLNESADTVRTGFSFATDSDYVSLPGEPTLREIRNAAIQIVQDDLAPLFTEITSSKRTTVVEHIKRVSPRYRSLLPHMDEFIDSIPPNPGGLPLELALHEQYYERERQLKVESHALVEDAKNHSLTPKDYENRLGKILEAANEFGKSSLAQYVVHRRVMLDFLEESLRQDGESRKYSPEEVVHRIIYPMRTTSDEVPYDKQNLWIIDERLAYHSLLASDKPLNQIPGLTVDSADRPDLLIFDRALSFSEESPSRSPLDSIMIVEFKKPDRRSYRKEDPIQQVFRLVEDLETGHFKDHHGVEIKVCDNFRTFAYIICDPTKEIDQIAKEKGFQRTPDGAGWHFYNPEYRAAVEIIPYQRLLGNARMRNRVLFDKLGLAD